MAAAISVSQVLQGLQGTMFIFNITLSGSYPTGGEVLDFTKATQDAAFQGLYAVPPVVSLGPLQIDVWMNGAATVDTLMDYQLLPILGTTLANCKLAISGEDTFGTELAAGLYSSNAADLILATTKITGSLVVPREL